jgi:hypothetical protein
MTVKCLGIGAGLALCGTLASQPRPAAPATFRVIFQAQQKYQQPVGIIEGSPGVFYSMADAEIIFSITAGGSVTTLADYSQGPPYGILTPPVSACNELFYSMLTHSSGSTTSNVISVNSTPGNVRTYPSQSYFPFLTQNLPDGDLLAEGLGPYRLLKSDLGGNVSVLYEFPTGDTPGHPIYGDGHYYGTAWHQDGNGYLYRMTPSGTLTKLHNFPVGTSYNWYAAPLLATDGNLYGLTAARPSTIFKLTASGQYTTLYTFPKSVGAPNAIIEASDGKLYGGTDSPGPSNLFRLSKSGHYEVAYQMGDTADGQCPCYLVQGSDGKIYGTAIANGATGGGTIWALDAGLPKPAPRPLEFDPKHGRPGTKVRIWGYNLLSASAEFNGVPATAVSSSGSNYVWATVPAGATTGPITVTTPGGQSTTTAVFRVNSRATSPMRR